MFKKQKIKLIPNFLLILLIQILSVIKTHAQNSDQQLWTNITAVGPLVRQQPAIRYWLEIQDRVGEDVSQLSQLLIRPGLGYQFLPSSSFWLGYAAIHTSVPFSDPNTFENRIWEQFLWSQHLNSLRLTGRSRLEQRFIENTYHTAWRFRQMFKTNIFIPKHSKYEFVVSDELFFHLNNFNQQNNTGFDQNRLFLGIGYKASNNSNLEIGYLNQLINRFQRDNYSGNYLAVTLLLS